MQKQPVVHCRGCGKRVDLRKAQDHVSCRPEVKEAIEAEFEPKIQVLKEIAAEGFRSAA